MTMAVTLTVTVIMIMVRVLDNISVTVRIERTGLERWLGSLCFAPGQDTQLSQCFTSPSCINLYAFRQTTTVTHGLVSSMKGRRKTAICFVLRKALDCAPAVWHWVWPEYPHDSNNNKNNINKQQTKPQAFCGVKIMTLIVIWLSLSLLSLIITSTQTSMVNFQPYFEGECP